MSRTVLIAACLTLLGADAALAKAKAPYPMAADGTTNIADCAKVDPSHRNECISRSRPVTAKQIYAGQPKPKAVKKAVEAAPKVMVAAPVKAASKGFNIAKDGTTDINDCSKARTEVRDECISRARPLTGKQLMKFEKSHAVAAPKPVAKKPVPKKAEVAPVKAAVAAPRGKGFAIAKDGTTDIADCANANPDYRNECISRARPVKGAQIYRAAKSKS